MYTGDALVSIRRSVGLTQSIKALQLRFERGDYYVWLYRDEHGAPTSWERYSIVTTDREQDVITIEVNMCV